ncbi:hypothetical protein QQS21_001812 [Conoideocrella luteorostrata]|uniref:Inheritance of peroxisomes protein 1 n=1 Tax=Conoideocrella luteorostrata TaxID=1105319 RepID=A0AAJ0CWL8_9HYPO|nr:hypothetical protein QQS21_001812 [Conoideocrella luteorostrata]
MESRRIRRQTLAAPDRVSTEPSINQRHRQDQPVVETLYSHQDVKIVSFIATSRRYTDVKNSYSGEDKPSDLSWQSPLERTIAVGAFCVYRAPGSVAFISCGSALQPILPKSQCWRVEQDDSKFVLRIRCPYYWRIELPTSNSEQKAQARQFSNTLDSILLFEKTECPFQRPFAVVIPIAPEVKRKPWTPMLQQDREEESLNPDAKISSNTLAFHQTNSNVVTTSAQSSANSFPTRGYGATAELPDTYFSATQRVQISDLIEREAEHVAHNNISAVPLRSASTYYSTSEYLRTSPARHQQAKEPSVNNPCKPTNDNYPGPDGTSTEFRSVGGRTEPPVQNTLSIYSSYNVFQGLGNREFQQQPKLRYFLGYRGNRSFTSSSQLTSTTTASGQEPEIFGMVSGVECRGSLHNASSNWVLNQATQPSQPPSKRVLQSPNIGVHFDEGEETMSNQHNLPGINRDWSYNCEDACYRLSEIDGDKICSTHHATSTGQEVGPRIGLEMEKASILSGSPGTGEPVEQEEATPILASQSQSVRLARRLPLAAVRKTCNILMGPPGHLAALMLNIAARIYAGEWKGQDTDFVATGRVVPVRWHYSNGEISSWSHE